MQSNIHHFYSILAGCAFLLIHFIFNFEENSIYWKLFTYWNIETVLLHIEIQVQSIESTWVLSLNAVEKFLDLISNLGSWVDRLKELQTLTA